MTAKERLEAARAARKALEEARQPSDEDLLEAQAAQEELALRNDQALAKAQDEHGAKNVAAVFTDSDVVLLKRPDAVRFKKFQDDVAKAESLPSDKVEQIVYSCVIYPDKSRFGAMLNEQPVIAQRCLVAIAELAGAKRAELGGKY